MTCLVWVNQKQDGSVCLCSNSLLSSSVHTNNCVVVWRVLPWQLCIQSSRLVTYWLVQHRTNITTHYLRMYNIIEDITRSLGSPWIVLGFVRRRGRCKERKQKRGCRAVLLTRLRKQPRRPSLPDQSSIK